MVFLFEKADYYFFSSFAMKIVVNQINAYYICSS